jgi:hypothetical protein
MNARILAAAPDLEEFAPAVDMQIDSGIRRAVLILRSEGIETFESCEGGEGHCFPEPTIRFHGNNGEGFKALSVALTYGLPVLALRRTYCVVDNEPTGPYWEIVLRNKDRPVSRD